MENPTTQFECKISNSSPDIALGLQILLDNVEIYNNSHVNDTVDFRHDLPEDEAEHELKFVLSGKTQEHTKIDTDGNIVSDALLSITDICFDEIDVSTVVTNLAVYSHDFNGTGQHTTAKFYGTLGCNGTLSLKFTTPIYLWLLENL